MPPLFGTHIHIIIYNRIDMILFFRTPSQSVIAAECDHTPDAADTPRLKTTWRDTSWVRAAR